MVHCPHPEVAQIETEGHSIVCGECGSVLRHIFKAGYIVGYDAWKLSPMVEQYTRVKRFEGLLDNCVTGLEKRMDYKVLEFIGHTKRTFQSTNEIRLFLKTIPFTDKRYCSLHLLSRVFSARYKGVSTKLLHHYSKVKKRMLQLFKDVEHAFFSKYAGPFLNYKFVLMVLLHFFDLSWFIQYVKPIQSAKRVSYNVTIFNSLQLKLDGRVLIIQDTPGGCEISSEPR